MKGEFGLGFEVWLWVEKVVEGAAHGMESALHVNDASGHTFADAVMGSVTRNPQLGEGRGLGGIPAEGRPHEQRPLFWMTPMCVYRSGWGAVVTAPPSPLEHQDFWGGT